MFLDIRLGRDYNTGKQKGEEAMIAYKHDHTHLTSLDPDKVVEFYTKTLGAKVTREREVSGRRMIDIDLGGIPVRISSGTGADDAWKGLRFGLHHLGFIVDNLNETVTDLKAKGVEFVVEPKPGANFAFIKGPDNVLIEIIQKS